MNDIINAVVLIILVIVGTFVTIIMMAIMIVMTLVHEIYKLGGKLCRILKQKIGTL